MWAILMRLISLLMFFREKKVIMPRDFKNKKRDEKIKAKKKVSEHGTSIWSGILFHIFTR